MNAEDLLASIQIGYRKKSENNNDFYAWVVNNYKHHKIPIAEKIKQKHDSLPTKYEESHFYDMITDSFKELKDIVENYAIHFDGHRLKYRPIPLFGTAEFNNLSCYVTANQPVLIFSQALLKLASRVIDLFVQEAAAAIKNGGTLVKSVKDKYTRNFIDILYCFLHGIDPYYASPIEFSMLITDDEILEYEYDIYSSVFMFFAAHEYAHLLLGHLENNYNTQHSEINEVDVEIIQNNWEQECDADFLGAIITICKTGIRERNILGIRLAMSIYLLGMLNSDSPTTTHPPIKDRMDTLFELLKQKNFAVEKSYLVDKVFSPKLIEYYNFISFLSDKVKTTDVPYSTVKHIIYHEYPIKNERTMENE